MPNDYRQRRHPASEGRMMGDVAYMIWGDDSSAVSKDFEPEIDRVVNAKLCILEFVPEDIIAQVPRTLRIGQPLGGGGSTRCFWME